MEKLTMSWFHKMLFPPMCLLFVVLCFSCAEPNPGVFRTQQEHPSEIFKANFEGPSLEEAWLGGWQLPLQERLFLKPDPLNTTNQIICMTVKPGDMVAKGSRSELIWNHLDPEGSERWISWKVYIPEDFPYAKTIRDDKGRPNWQIMGQWHDTPKEGEESSHSPPLAIQTVFIDKQDPNYARSLSELKGIVGFDASWDKKKVFLLGHGAPPKGAAFWPATPGKWQTWLLHVKWSQKDDGFVQLWVDGKDITKGKKMGKNMYNELPNYFKLGLYRNPDIDVTQTVCYDDLRYGPTRKDAETP
ncbi:MAG: hypothetical protein CL920_02105 [Deltaproteobacteria bacterium]|nr:hypothetical protein [Deltaproteobacteria bacterium]|tara:strand:+ start:1132 stop:2034 length:903 start_codon:yes stop_codon:yes gene_type:complete